MQRGCWTNWRGNSGKIPLNTPLLRVNLLDYGNIVSVIIVQYLRYLMARFLFCGSETEKTYVDKKIEAGRRRLTQ